MKITKYSPNHKNELESLINSIYDKEIPLYVLNMGNVVVAFKNEVIIGFAAYRRSELHNKIVTVEIGVSKENRRCGVGTRLHQSLLSLFPLRNSEVGADGCCFSHNEGAQNFLDSLGYVKYLDCNVLIINLEDELHSSIEVEVKSLADLYTNEIFKEKIRSFYISRYTNEHKWSPVTSDPAVWDDYYDDGNSLDLGVAIVKDDKVIGCSFAYTGFGEELEEENDNLLGIGGTYSQGTSLNEQVRLTKALLAYQLALAKKMGHKEAYIEVDSTEAESSEILNWLSIKKIQVFERYRLKK